MKSHVGIALAVALSVASWTGCGEPKQEFRLYCGAGIQPAAEELAEAFGREHGVTVSTDFDGSERLLARIDLSKQGDLYMPGDIHYVEQAAERGYVVDQADVCYFVPCIIVQKGNPKGIETLEDLVTDDPEFKLGLGNPEACAVGRKSRKIFAKNAIDESRIRPDYESVTVNDLAAQVAIGSLDASIVWDAVAANFSKDCDIVKIPANENIISTVPCASLSFSKQPELAKAFVEFASSDRGREIFAKHDYTTQLEDETPAADGDVAP